MPALEGCASSGLRTRRSRSRSAMPELRRRAALGADGPVDQRRVASSRQGCPRFGCLSVRPGSRSRCRSKPDGPPSGSGAWVTSSKCGHFIWSRLPRCSCLASRLRRSLRTTGSLQRSTRLAPANRSGATRGARNSPSRGVRRRSGPLRDHQHDVASALGEEQIAGLRWRNVTCLPIAIWPQSSADLLRLNGGGVDETEQSSQSA